MATKKTTEAERGSRKGKYKAPAGTHPSHFPEDTPLNERFSASGEKRLGVKRYRNRKERMAEQLATGMDGEFPSPKLVDLDTSNPVLKRIEEKKLRTRVATFLETLLEGGLHKEALAKTDFTWNHLQNLFHQVEGLRALYRECRDLGEEYRKIVRIDAAHERAVDGVEDPIYSQRGEYLGSRKLYSDRLLELLLKADAPKKFGVVRGEGDGGGMVVNISLGIDRDELREELRLKDAKANAVDGEFEEVR